MSVANIQLVIYPLLAESVSDAVCGKASEKIVTLFSDSSDEDMATACNNRLDEAELKKKAKLVSGVDAKIFFNLARELVELGGSSMAQMKALSILGKALGIKADDTGFDFDLFAEQALIEFEYHRTVVNFSMVAAAIGFIPFPIADLAVLTTMQVAMVTKIATLYKFQFDVKQFLKMIGGTVGAGIVFRITAKIIGSMIPVLGWIVNASIAFAGTYAIGMIARRYAEAGGDLTKESIRQIWEESYRDGKKEFVKLKDYILKKKDELVEEFKKRSEEYKEGTSDQEPSNTDPKSNTRKKSTKKGTSADKKQKDDDKREL